MLKEISKRQLKQRLKLIPKNLRKIKAKLKNKKIKNMKILRKIIRKTKILNKITNFGNILDYIEDSPKENFKDNAYENLDYTPYKIV